MINKNINKGTSVDKKFDEGNIVGQSFYKSQFPFEIMLRGQTLCASDQPFSMSYFLLGGVPNYSTNKYNQQD